MPAKKTAKRRRRTSRKMTPAQRVAVAELIRLSGVKIDPRVLAKMRAEWEE